jgi:hypothetical protein
MRWPWGGDDQNLPASRTLNSAGRGDQHCATRGTRDANLLGLSHGQLSADQNDCIKFCRTGQGRSPCDKPSFSVGLRGLGTRLCFRARGGSFSGDHFRTPVCVHRSRDRDAEVLRDYAPAPCFLVAKPHYFVPAEHPHRPAEHLAVGLRRTDTRQRALADDFALELRDAGEDRQEQAA